MWHLTSRFASKRPQQRHSIFANSATATSLAIAEYLRSTSSMSQKSGPANQVLRGPRNAISCKLDPQSTKFAETESAGEGAGGGGWTCSSGRSDSRLISCSFRLETMQTAVPNDQEPEAKAS